MYSAFYNKILSRCFTESETQGQNPQVSTVAKEKLPVETGRVKDKNERDRTERVKRGRERKHFIVQHQI